MFIEVFYLSIKSLHPNSRWFQRRRKKQTEKIAAEKIAVDFELIKWNFVLFREFEEFIFQIKLFKLINMEKLSVEIEFQHKTMELWM